MSENSPDYNHVVTGTHGDLRDLKADAWDECVEALAWALNNGPSESALGYVADHNPYRGACPCGCPARVHIGDAERDAPTCVHCGGELVEVFVGTFWKAPDPMPTMWVHSVTGARACGWAEPRCQHVSPSPWGPTQCALPDGHAERHAYSPSETVTAPAEDVL